MKTRYIFYMIAELFIFGFLNFVKMLAALQHKINFKNASNQSALEIHQGMYFQYHISSIIGKVLRA